MTTAITRRLRHLCSRLRTIAPESAVEWADNHFYLSGESSNVEGPWTTAPYQVVPLNLIGNDDCEALYFRKSARVGYTKMMVAGGAYLIVHKKRNGVTYQPTDDDVKDFVQDEIDPAIRDVKILRDNCIDFNKQTKNNKAQKKIFTGATWDFKGGKSPKNYRRLTKDFAQVDEANGFDIEVGHEGCPMELAPTRLIGSPFPKFVVGTTPTIKQVSHIAKLMDKAHVCLKLYLPCLHCGHEQVLRLGGKDDTFGLKYLKTAEGELVPGSAKFLCENPDCGCLWEYGDLYDMQVAGRWRNSDASVWTRDGLLFFNQDNAPIATPLKIGLDIWSAYSLHDGWHRLAERHITALKNPLAFKKFVNTDLGQDWEDKLSEQLDWRRLHHRRERYCSPVPQGAVYLTGGIDTQDNRLEFYVWGWGSDVESWLIWHEVVMGRPDDPQVITDCAKVLFRTFDNSNGIPMGVSRWGWDSQGHYHSTVLAASKKHGLFWVIPVHGSPNYGKPIVTMPKEKRSNGTYASEVGTDTAKEWIYNHFGIDLINNSKGDKSIDNSTPGYVHLPLDEAICSEVECKQLVSEVRMVKTIKGKRSILFDAKGRRNEALDCFVYALAVLHISIMRFGLNLNELAVSKQVQANPVSPVHKLVGNQAVGAGENSTAARLAALGRKLGTTDPD